MLTRTTLAAATVTSVLAATVWAAPAAEPAAAHSATGRSGRAQPGQPAGTGEPCSARARIAGYSDTLDKSDVDGVPVAGLSALAQDAHGRTLALSDRSVLFPLAVRQHDGAPDAHATGAVPLADGKGDVLDSEGLVVQRDGSRLVTSETEPSVGRYTPDGRLTGRLPVPRALRVAPLGRAQPNETFEGLTAQHGGRTLTASMESPLIGDGRDAHGRPQVRLQNWDRHRHGDFRPARQWAYPLDRELGVAEIAATGDGRLLVLERGYDADAGANTIRLYLADPRRAADVSHTVKLSAHDRPVRKTLLADMADCPDMGAPNPSPQPNPLLDNIEALTVTDHGPGGRLSLLLASDDNESAQQITRLYALHVRLPRQS